MKKLHILTALLTCTHLSLQAENTNLTFTTSEGKEIECKVQDEKAKTLTVIGNSQYKSYSGTVTIPDTTKGYSITSIDQFAFQDCNQLTAVTLPGSIQEIGLYAFYNCTGLTALPLPEGLQTIGHCAFHSCTNLTSQVIPSTATSIGVSPYIGCNSLSSIVVANGNTRYDSRDSCNAIIETATNTLIAGCKATIIPSTVVAIGDEAFQYNSGLTCIDIPEGVTTIGFEAFASCNHLTSVTLPGSLTVLGAQAFQGCTQLTDIYCYADSVPQTGSLAFQGVPTQQCTLHVPSQALKAYQAAEAWNGFATIVPLPNTVPDEQDKPAKWDIDGDGQLTLNDITVLIQKYLEAGQCFRKKSQTVVL